MSRELLHLIVGIVAVVAIIAFSILVIYTIWNFSYFLLKVDLTILWLIVVLIFMDEITK